MIETPSPRGGAWPAEVLVRWRSGCAKSQVPPDAQRQTTYRYGARTRPLHPARPFTLFQSLSRSLARSRLVKNYGSPWVAGVDHAAASLQGERPLLGTVLTCPRVWPGAAAFSCQIIFLPGPIWRSRRLLLFLPFSPHPIYHVPCTFTSWEPLSPLASLQGRPFPRPPLLPPALDLCHPRRAKQRHRLSFAAPI